MRQIKVTTTKRVYEAWILLLLSILTANMYLCLTIWRVFIVVKMGIQKKSVLPGESHMRDFQSIQKSKGFQKRNLVLQNNPQPKGFQREDLVLLKNTSSKRIWNYFIGIETLWSLFCLLSGNSNWNGFPSLTSDSCCRWVRGAAVNVGTWTVDALSIWLVM